jgi:hypothetical protein
VDEDRLGGFLFGVLQVSLPDAYWNRLGLLPLTQTWQRLNPTA